MTSQRVLVTVAFAVVVIVASERTADAQLGVNCTISTGGVAFGSYNVYNMTPTDSAGTITYQCTAGVGIRIDLSRGTASTFAPRVMTNGANTFQYNLYLDSAHTTIWGDGSGGTSFFTDTVLLLPKTVTVYGRIPAQQHVAVGSYSDSLTATIVF